MPYSSIEDFIQTADCTFLSLIPGGGALEKQISDISEYAQKFAQHERYRSASAQTLAFLNAAAAHPLFTAITKNKSELTDRLYTELKFSLQPQHVPSCIGISLLLRDTAYTKNAVFTADRPQLHKSLPAIIDETVHLCNNLMPSVSDVFLALVFKSLLPHQQFGDQVALLSQYIAVCDVTAKIAPFFPNSSGIDDALTILSYDYTFYGLNPYIIESVRTGAAA